MAPAAEPVIRRGRAGGGSRVAAWATDSSSSVCHSQPSAPLTAEPNSAPEALMAAAIVAPTQARAASNRAVGEMPGSRTRVPTTPTAASTARRITKRKRQAICRAAAK